MPRQAMCMEDKTNWKVRREDEGGSPVYSIDQLFKTRMPSV